MAASEHRNNAVMSTTQLVQYDDDDDNDDKGNAHSGHIAAVREHSLGHVGMTDDTRRNASNAHLVGQEGMGGVAGTDRVDEGNRGYHDEHMDGGGRADVYMETGFREEVVVQQTHTGAEGSETMRVFCSFDTVAAVGHTDEVITSSTPGANDYCEEDVQERGLEEVALEERVHGDQSEGYIPEEGGTGEGQSSFSGVQQLQLRAQILVYGDLIKGVLPDESLMSSAFSDANEGTEQESDRVPVAWNWEVPWQLAVEKEAERQRLAEEERINKGDVIMTEGDLVNAVGDNLEPGTPSTSPIRVAEDSIREEDLRGAMAPTGVTDNLSLGGVDEQTADVNVVAAGLPVNLDAVVDNIVATTVSSIDSSLLKDSGVTQATRSPSLDPWLKPPPAQVPLAPTSQDWQTPVQTANVGLGSQAPMVNTPSVTAKPGVDGGVVAHVPTTATGNAEEKASRKRKSRARERKTPAPKETGSTPRRSRAKTASVGKPAPQASTPDANPLTEAVPSRLIFESSEADVVTKGGSPASPTAGKTRDAQGRSNLHAETQSWLEQAKASFEEAVSAANSAAEQVQLVNSVTATPKSGKGAQLTSVAAAVNAAASVAKAAAEAAKVAYEAALQATMMVSDGIDTSLGKGGMGNGDKDGGLGGRRSAIAAAKEEARKRATATTPSMKITPQSTDAVLRAARLMAEAASQAGAVLAKGNSATPLTVPMSPVSHLDFKKSEARNRPKREKATVKSPEPIKSIETEPAMNVKGSMKKGARRRGKELQELAASNTPAQKNGGQAKLSPGKATRRQLDQTMATASSATEPPEVLYQSQIVDGSLVEVMNDEEGLRGGWFSAKVLQLRPGEAYVQYDEILTDDGLTKLEEWFPVEGPLDGTARGRPRIRVISPNNIAREESRRKRRRTTTGQKVWSLGDRVDAFVQDGWWEGVIKSIDEDDESKITVNFPADAQAMGTLVVGKTGDFDCEGDTSIIKSWNLRPSILWKDGRWEQWIPDPMGHIKQDDGQQSKKLTVSESPKVQARKSGRGKSILAGNVSEETPESLRASTRSKSTDSQSAINPVSPPVTTRSSPRQKIPPKRKDGPTEVSTPTQAPTPVSTRTRSIAEDAINPVKEPLKRSAPSRTKSPLRADVEKKENLSKELRSLLGNSVPSQEKSLLTTGQQAEDVAKPVTRRSARL